jgi:hypothetical protein
MLRIILAYLGDKSVSTISKSYVAPEPIGSPFGFTPRNPCKNLVLEQL